LSLGDLLLFDLLETVANCIRKRVRGIGLEGNKTGGVGRNCVGGEDGYDDKGNRNGHDMVSAKPNQSHSNSEEKRKGVKGGLEDTLAYKGGVEFMEAKLATGQEVKGALGRED
jgi:hypothetical protein